MTKCNMLAAGQNKIDWKMLNVPIENHSISNGYYKHKELETWKPETTTQTAKRLHDQTEDDQVLDHLRLTDT